MPNAVAVMIGEIRSVSGDEEACGCDADVALS
jgi:hypothetical protein